MQTTTKTKLRFTLLGIVIGTFLVGVVFGLYAIATKHHYKELETFYRGNVAGHEVVGISYFDHHGFAFMEYAQWRVQMKRTDGQLVTLYQSSPMFQEALPHQPKIEIKDKVVHIDDGMVKLAITVEK
jgi:hypothetical protein